jgi:hypothetical protein
MFTILPTKVFDQSHVHDDMVSEVIDCRKLRDLSFDWSFNENLAPYLSGNEAVLGDNPSSFWMMDEASGTVMVDAMHVKDGVITAPQFGQPGREPGTLSLTTTGSELGHISNRIEPVYNQPFTIEICFYGNPFTGNNGAILYTGLVGLTFASGGAIQCWGTPSTTSFVYGQDASNYVLGYFHVTPAADQWHTLAYVWDGVGGLKAYFDGVPQTLYLEASIGTITGNPSWPGPMYIASYDPGGVSNLAPNHPIDWLAYWEGTALTEQQLLEHTLGRPVPPQNMQPQGMMVGAPVKGELGLEVGGGIGPGYIIPLHPAGL